MEVIGIKTDLIEAGDDLVEAIQKGMNSAGLTLVDGDILVISESVVATWEGRVIDLKGVVPGPRALDLAARYEKDPREMELILRESDQVVGGIPGVVLTLKDGFLYPNAGVDHSNAPQGHVILLPFDPRASAGAIRTRLARGRRIGVIIGDSRTHPLRLGCVGVALASEGVSPVVDARGQLDLYGKPLTITQKAVADNLVSAAQIVMGEGDERVPAVIIRGAPVEVTTAKATAEMPRIEPHECMYIGALRCGLHPYPGGYEELIDRAKEAREKAYAPYSKFKVGAAVLTRGGRIYSAGNIENASSGTGICAERAAIAEAVASGDMDIQAMAVVGDTAEPLAPCGICRQTLIEFGEDIEVVMANLKGDATMATAAEILPKAFTGGCLKEYR